MFQFIILFTIGFLIFIELYVGSVMFRRNSENKISFNLSSGLNFLINPLQSGFLWHPSGLLMNYPLMLLVVIVLNLIYKKLSLFYTNNGISSRVSQSTTSTNIKESL